MRTSCSILTASAASHHPRTSLPSSGWPQLPNAQANALWRETVRRSEFNLQGKLDIERLAGTDTRRAVEITHRIENPSKTTGVESGSWRRRHRGPARTGYRKV